MTSRYLFALTMTILCGAAAADDAALEGRWERTNGSPALVLRFGDALDPDAAAEADFPGYEITGVPLGKVEREGDSVDIQYGARDSRGTVALVLKEGKLRGTWKYGAFESEVVLEPRPETRRFTREEVSFENDGTKLGGVLLLPEGAGPHPAVVWYHGSGDNERGHYFYQSIQFAEAGIACLITDKRGNHDSEGDWRTAGFDVLAEDGLAAVRHLKGRAEIDPERIGIIGISQACWIMPIAAAASEDVKFLVSISGAMVTPRDEGHYDFLVRVQDAGFGEAELTQARALLELDDNVSRGTADIKDLIARVKEVRDEGWFQAMEFTPAPGNHYWRGLYKQIIDYDPMPVWAKVKVPVLFVYGMDDKSVHAPTSIALLQPLLDDPTRKFTLRTFEGADHGIRVPGGPAESFPLQPHAPGFYDSVLDWVKAQCAAE